MVDKFNPPWEQAAWLGPARAWVKAQLAELGLNLNGETEQIHVRPWSTVIRVQTREGAVFFKAGAPNQAFEPALVRLLRARHPEASPPILAVDESRGWMLLADGGRILRHAHLNEAARQRAWEEMLRRFAQLQIALAARHAELLATGLPDRRPSKLPGLFHLVERDKALLRVGRSDGLGRDQYQRLLGMAPQLAEWCGALDSGPIPASIDHGDLHSANIFYGEGGELTFFDWGDASLAHPFFSLMVPLRALGNDLERQDGVERFEQDPAFAWARRAYLEAWTHFAPMKELEEIWAIALRVGKFQRSLSSHKMLSEFEPESVKALRGHWAAWMAEFVE